MASAAEFSVDRRRVGNVSTGYEDGGDGGKGVRLVTEGLGRGDRHDRGPQGGRDVGESGRDAETIGRLGRDVGRPGEPVASGWSSGPGGGRPIEGGRVNEGGPGEDGLGLVRVEATTFSEALREIRARYGDAVSIVHTRVIRRKGMLGVLGATGVEVYVTGRGEYEEWRRRPADARSQKPASPHSSELQSSAYQNPAYQNPALQKPGLQNPVFHDPGPRAPRIDDRPGLSSFGSRAPAEDTPDVVAALERLSKKIGHVMAERSHGAASSTPVTPRKSAQRGSAPVDPANYGTAAVGRTTASADAPNGPSFPVQKASHPVVAAAKRLLDERGFSSGIAAELLTKLSRRELPTLASDPDECRELARLQLRELVRPKLPPAQPIPRPGNGGRRIVALVGPTGVGKTTTLAKLGALFRITERARVAFITLDTYRIGAVDQLRRYSDIIQVPLEVVSPGSGLSEALERVRDADLVLLDTAGRSQKDAERIGELREMLEGVGDLEVHLCLALSSSPEAILAAADTFRPVGYSRILLTKLDESYRHGVLLDLFQSERTSISYITCGQEVPDDIRPATLERLEDLLLGEQ